MNGCREAISEDVPQIYKLIAIYAKDGLLLPRKESEIRAHINDFVVFEKDHKLVACAALSAYSKLLVEIRSLVVDPDFQRQGLGSQIVECAENLARKKNFSRVFVLTRSEKFFQKLSYHIVEKSVFPEKIWKDCAICPRKDHCDEVAMQKIFSEES